VTRAVCICGDCLGVARSSDGGRCHGLYDPVASNEASGSHRLYILAGPAPAPQLALWYYSFLFACTSLHPSACRHAPSSRLSPPFPLWGFAWRCRPGILVLSRLSAFTSLSLSLSRSFSFIFIDSCTRIQSSRGPASHMPGLPRPSVRVWCRTPAGTLLAVAR
jgi:hypothetical protein